ncbi:MAG: hypothetical protein HUU20_04155 [Pirellulales bacterium]|nr:hypothetical protein [Pirellulales bacterium]
MQLKSTILSVLGLRALGQIADKLEIDVDHRSSEAIRTALSQSPRTTVGELLQYLRKDEIKAVCQCAGLADGGRREEMLKRLASLHASLTQGLEDGSRIKSYRKGWVVVDGQGCYLAEPESATWVVSSRSKELPPAVFPTPAAAYLGWLRSQEAAKGQMAR